MVAPGAPSSTGAPHPRALWRVALIAGLVVSALWIAHGLDPVTAWETRAVERLRAVPGGAGDAFARALHAAGYWYGVLPVMAVLVAGLALRRRLRDAAFALVALGGGLLLNAGLKLVIARPRPDADDATVLETTLSFPSGHANASAALATALVLLAWPTRARLPVMLAGGCFALAVGVSRVMAGVHHPGDVLAGWALGIGWVCAVRALAPAHTGPSVRVLP